MQFIDSIKERAKQDVKTIVLPESMDKRTFEAAEKILKEGIANIVIIGTPEEISKYSEGYVRRLLVKHEYDAVNPMFMVFSRRLYEIFAEEKEGDWRLSMIKFCFNVAENGGRIVFTPFADKKIRPH